MDNERPYRRQAQYTAQIGVKLLPETRAQVDRLADAYGLSLSDVVRQACESGIAKVADRLRKQCERKQATRQP